MAIISNGVSQNERCPNAHNEAKPRPAAARIESSAGTARVTSTDRPNSATGSRCV